MKAAVEKRLPFFRSLWENPLFHECINVIDYLRKLEVAGDHGTTKFDFALSPEMGQLVRNKLLNTVNFNIPDGPGGGREKPVTRTSRLEKIVNLFIQSMSNKKCSALTGGFYRNWIGGIQKEEARNHVEFIQQMAHALQDVFSKGCLI